MKFIVAILIASVGVVAAGAQNENAQPLKPGNGVTAPTLLKEVKPSYPSDALSAGLSGVVWLEAVVETDGSVGEVRVKEPLYPSLDEAAVAALKSWRFQPARRDGKPVRVAVDVEITFTYRGGPALDSADVLKPAPGVTVPVAIKEVKPSYTQAAIAARIEGSVTIDAVILSDGTVGNLRVSKRLHPELDVQAVRALKQWRFSPGRHDGKPVPVQVSVEMTFALK